jgi:hypothetical protein
VQTHISGEPSFAVPATKRECIRPRQDSPKPAAERRASVGSLLGGLRRLRVRRVSGQKLFSMHVTVYWAFGMGLTTNAVPARSSSRVVIKK